MKRIFGNILRVTILICLGACSPDFASPKTLNGQDNDSIRLGQRLSSVFDHGVLFFAHINLNKLDLDEVETKLKKLLDLPDKVSFNSGIQAIKKTIQDAGGQHIFVSFSLTDMTNLPAIAIPVEREFDTSTIVPLVKSLAEYEVRYLRQPKIVVLASSKTFARIESGSTPSRKDIAKLIRPHLDEVASINFVPSVDHRRILREFEPEFSPPFSELDGNLLGRSLKSASLVLADIQPLKLSLKIRSEDQATASNLKKVFSRIMTKLPDDTPELNFFRKLENSLVISKSSSGLEMNVGPEEEKGWMKTILPFFVKAKLEVQQSDEVNNLKQILLGMHNFHDVYRGFPDLGQPKDNGKPGLSWRVHILPFIEQNELYEKFRLDEPWDSEHNRKLIAKMPNVFRTANTKIPEGHTAYVMPRGKGFFASPYPKSGDPAAKGFRGRQFRAILDGTSNTIAVLRVTSENSVVWTKPEDWSPDQKNCCRQFGKMEWIGYCSRRPMVPFIKCPGPK